LLEKESRTKETLDAAFNLLLHAPRTVTDVEQHPVECSPNVSRWTCEPPDFQNGLPNDVQYQLHEVKGGETVMGLELKYSVPVRDIKRANPHLLDVVSPGFVRIPIV